MLMVIPWLWYGSGAKKYNGKLTYDEKHNPITTALIIELKDGKMTLNKKIGG